MPAATLKICAIFSAINGRCKTKLAPARKANWFSGPGPMQAKTTELRFELLLRMRWISSSEPGKLISITTPSTLCRLTHSPAAIVLGAQQMRPLTWRTANSTLLKIAVSLHATRNSRGRFDRAVLAAAELCARKDINGVGCSVRTFPGTEELKFCLA